LHLFRIIEAKIGENIAASSTSQYFHKTIIDNYL
jgi:hypothetical protein